MPDKYAGAPDPACPGTCRRTGHTAEPSGCSGESYCRRSCGAGVLPASSGVVGSQVPPVTLTLSASPATTLLDSPRGSVRRVSGFVLVGNTARTPPLSG